MEKLTFLKLLTKLIEPTSGEIYIDGEPADPTKHNISFCIPGTFRISLADCAAEYRIRAEGKKETGKEIKEQTDKIIGLLGLEKFRMPIPMRCRSAWSRG